MHKFSVNRVIGFLLILLFVSLPAFSQNIEEDELEQLLNQEENVSDIRNELQKNFIMIEGVREHELNPQVTSYAADSQLMTGLYEGLFSYNPRTLEPVPAIASDYKISRDKKRWQFTINPNAKFSNGEKITAESVRQSWLQLLSDPAAPYASLLDVVINAENFRLGLCGAEEVGIYALKENELSVYLRESANYLPKLLCHSAFSVIHTNPSVFSGPFYLEDYNQGVYLLKKNPYYWDVENTHLEQITILQSDDDDENSFYYNTGVADWITTSVNTNTLINKSSIQMGAEFATNYFFFKTNAAKPKGTPVSPFDYPEFRNAVFEAMPWDILREGSYFPTKTFVYPLAGYPSVEGFDYTDVIEAKTLMKNARKKYGIEENALIPLILEINENAVAPSKLDAIKSALLEIDVDLQVITMPFNFYLQSIPMSTADLFCYSWIGDFADPLAFLELFRTKSTLNDSGWSNPDYDALLEKAAMVSSEERYKYLAQAEEILLDNYMVIPIQNPVTFNIVNLSEVGGWAINAFDIHPLKYLYRKERKNSLPNVVRK